MKIITTLLFVSLSIGSKAQDVSVTKTVFGVQAGLVGIWIHNESRLTNVLTLRSELGFDTGIWEGYFYDKTGFLLAPVFTAEPRFYYNLRKRDLKSKDITNNSGNFISLTTKYHPDWFVISNYKDISVVADISIIPTWGIRRNIGIHFNYEAGFGLGYRYYFSKDAGFDSNESELTANLVLRIGYVF